jgi:hypothetical protein
MEQLLLNTSDFRQLYNCSFYDVDSIPLARRQRLVLGVALAVVSLVEEVS